MSVPDSVREALTSRGWLPLEDKSSIAFTLKWAETSKSINYKYAVYLALEICVTTPT